jgi:hypothetical protein
MAGTFKTTADLELGKDYFSSAADKITKRRRSVDVDMRLPFGKINTDFSKFEQSIEAYNETNQSRQYAEEDFGSESAAQDFLNRQAGASTQAPSQAPSQTTDKQQEKPTLDPLSWLLSSTLKGAL